MIKNIDPEIALIIEQEELRQKNSINLIASENYTHPAVLQATGSILTNKYAEGYPNKRYYAGCQFVDKAESLAISRLKQLFNAQHANVQPHSGSSANLAAYAAILKPGDTILGMSLASGGHLTHGHNVNFSGKFYNVVQYGVNRNTECLDFDEILSLAQQHKPKLIIAGASAYPRTIDFEKFSEIAKSVNAYFLADIAHIAGLISAGLHPSPFPHADIVTGTTHKTLRGPRGGFILSKQELAENIDKAIMPGNQGGPLMHTIAAKAVAFKLALDKEFIDYQKNILENAKIMTQEFINLGYRLVTGGTDNHLFIIDLTDKNITGKLAQDELEKIGIDVSRSCIPFDTQKPWITSGIRIGTPAITTRGLSKTEIINIVHRINTLIKSLAK